MKKEIEELYILKKKSSPDYHKKLNQFLQQHVGSNEFFLIFDKVMEKKDFDLAKILIQMEPDRILRYPIICKQIARDCANNQGKTYFCTETVHFLDKVLLPALNQKFSETNSKLTSALQLYSFYDISRSREYINFVNDIHINYPDVHISYGVFFRIINQIKDEIKLISLLKYDKYGLFTDTLKKTGRVEHFFSSQIPHEDNPDILPVMNELKEPLITILNAGFFDLNKVSEYNNKYFLCYLFALCFTQQLDVFNLNDDKKHALLINELSAQYSRALFYLYPDFCLNKNSHFSSFIQQVNIQLLCGSESKSLQHFFENIMQSDNFDFLQQLFMSSFEGFRINIPFSEYVRASINDKKSVFFVLSQSLDAYEQMCIKKEAGILNSHMQQPLCDKKTKIRI